MLEESLNREVSAEKIKEALRGITVTEFKIDGRSFYLKNKLDKVGKGLFKALKVKEPAVITPKEEFKI